MQTCRQIGLRGRVHWECATATDAHGTAVELGECLCDGEQDHCLHDRRYWFTVSISYSDIL